MYRIKIIRPNDDQPLFLGHPVNRRDIFWHDPKYAKPFLTRDEAEGAKRHLKETRGRSLQIHIERIEA